MVLEEDKVEEILDSLYSYLKEKRGIDFTLYRQDTFYMGYGSALRL